MQKKKRSRKNITRSIFSTSISNENVPQIGAENCDEECKMSVKDKKQAKNSSIKIVKKVLKLNA
jgi:hypothetical protein